MSNSDIQLINEKALSEIEARAEAARDCVLALPRATTGDLKASEPLPVPLGDAEVAFIRQVKADIPAMAATIRAAWATVAHFESPDDAGICRFCGNLRSVPHGHIQRCYCIPTIRRYRDENSELRQRLAEVKAERDRLQERVQICEYAFTMDEAVKIPGTGDLNALQVSKKLAELANFPTAVLALLDEKAAEWASDAERQTSYQPAIDYTKRDAARELKGLVEGLK